MPLDETRARAITPKLIEWLTELRTIVGEITERAIHRADDDFAFMALCFVAKQLDHGESVTRLVPTKDTGLVARTMLEGMVQLKWASEDSVRPSRWRAFAIVEDWEMIPIWERDGVISDALRRKIAAAIEEHKDLIYTRKALRAEQEEAELPDRPFFPDWRAGVGVSEILKSPENSQFKSVFYRPLSAWVHWSPGGLRGLLESTAEGVRYESESYADAASALFLAIYSTWECTHLLATRLVLEDAIAKLEGFSQRFEQWHEETETSSAPDAE